MLRYDSSRNWVHNFTLIFFDRTSLAFLVKEKIQILPLNQVQYAIDNYFINADTLYFNNLVSTKEQLENNWIIPVKNSWIAGKFGIEGKAASH